MGLQTAEPLKVDVNVKLDVYQHADPELRSPAAPSLVQGDAEARRRARMGEIQELKNSRIVGENHLGLLALKNEPAGDYGKYVVATVEAENADRFQMMEQIAASEGVALAEVQKQQAELWRDRAFGGEWIEMPAPAGGWAWVQKGSEE